MDDGPRFDGPERVMFLKRLDFEPTVGKAQLRPQRVTPHPTVQGQLQPILYEGPHSWVEVSRRYGTGEYKVPVQDHEQGPNGPESACNIRQHARIMCEGFGPPRNIAAAAVPAYAAEPSIAPAPAAPREAPTMKPPMVQTLPEMQASGDPMMQMCMQMFAHLMQGRQAEGSRELDQFRAEVTRELGLVRADVTKVVEALAGFGKQLAGVVDALAQKGKALEISSVEQAADTISRFEAMAPVILRNGGAAAATSAKDEDAEDGEDENMLGQILATVQEVSGAVREASAAMQALAPIVQSLRGAAAAPAEGTGPFGRVQRPVNGHGHASAPKPDTSS